ncbi:MAG: UDP-N-acetylmuramoyl-tripeptide--D-alanyl-D-alanine ligase, partial [Muribaculaceae bacterium]|nr:UDP-N-acetylmuramoyl-tripeptide--D-alanyl-D-alanine ligase [Muribaculaceae bacterium]
MNITLALILLIIVASLAAVNTALEFKRVLMMFQQNSYRADRYGHWLNESADTTSAPRLCGIFVFLAALAAFSFMPAGAALIGIFCAWNSWRLWRKKYKKPLVWTMRARRIAAVMWTLAAVMALAAVLLFGSRVSRDIFAVSESLLLCYCASHLLVLTANTILTPVEKAINRKYYRQAQDILRSMPGLKIIGVTGSYGKTSTKHFLFRILSEQFQTLMTPGNFNTTLGVVRTVREHLRPFHEVFIVEMGAKQNGDIREICDLVHPSTGIVTAVGPQHLESFGSIENVQATKFELIDALPPRGLAVVNNDFEKIADRKVENVPCVRYAVKNPTPEADYVAEDIRYSGTGTEFTAVCRRDGHRIALSTRLVGECNISNILAAVAVARSLGVDDKKIQYAVGKIEQVEHRLSIRRIPGSYTIIDDAYN